jgi:exosortase
VGAGTLVYLRRQGVGEERETGARALLSRGDLAALAAVAAAYVLALWPTFAELGSQWTRNLWNNGHGIFIPPAIAYLGWRALRDLPDERARGSAWGFAVLAPALAIAVLGQHIGFAVLASLGLVLTLPGLSLLLLGVAGTRALLVPLAIAFLMIPIPNAVASHVYLRQFTAEAVGWIFGVVGFLHVREGTVIQTPGQIFVVADACSGFSTLYASLSVALILGAMARSLRLTALLLVAAVPLAMLANILRVLALIVATEWLGVWVLDSPLHAASGVATFGISLGGLFWLYGRRKERPAP